MTTIPIGDASLRLNELVDQLAPGEEIELTRGGDTVARLVKKGVQKRVRQLGLGKGKLMIVEDDEKHLEHFQEYMP